MAAMTYAVFAVRVLLGGLLLAAGLLKAGHAAELASTIATYRLLPAQVIGPLALALPYVEILLGAYLLAGLFTRIVATIAAVQFVCYAGAIASAVVRHIAANCGCFGPNDSATADWPHVAFDLMLAAASCFVAIGAPGALAVDRKLRSA
jgi:putative oxidoreductase